MITEKQSKVSEVYPVEEWYSEDIGNESQEEIRKKSFTISFPRICALSMILPEDRDTVFGSIMLRNIRGKHE
ncbi:MAG: hypothetical protein K6F83_03960 [Clostridiales bacterium]|nr:hypothetical protein [Clostridiales bacterium]